MVKDIFSQIINEIKKRKKQQEIENKLKNNSSTIISKTKNNAKKESNNNPKSNDFRTIKTGSVNRNNYDKKVNYYVKSKSGQFGIADVGTLDTKTTKKNLEAKKKEKEEAFSRYVQKSKEVNKEIAKEKVANEKNFDDLRFNKQNKKKLENYVKNPEFVQNTEQKYMERRTKSEADKITLNNTKEGAEYLNAKNQKNLAKTMYDVERLNDDNIGWFDKTLGIPGRAVSDLFSNVTGDKDYTENGRTVYLPSYAEMKQEKVSESYKNGLTRFLGDAAYNLS